MEYVPYSEVRFSTTFKLKHGQNLQTYILCLDALQKNILTYVVYMTFVL